MSKDDTINVIQEDGKKVLNDIFGDLMNFIETGNFEDLPKK